MLPDLRGPSSRLDLSYFRGFVSASLLLRYINVAFCNISVHINTALYSSVHDDAPKGWDALGRGANGAQRKETKVEGPSEVPAYEREDHRSGRLRLGGGGRLGLIHPGGGRDR